MEIKSTEKVRKLFYKGTIEILFYLRKVGKARYQEILSQHFTSSRETFSKRLSELESLNLIIREVENTRPPRVFYRLSEKGEKIVTYLNCIIKLLENGE